MLAETRFAPFPIAILKVWAFTARGAAQPNLVGRSAALGRRGDQPDALRVGRDDLASVLGVDSPAPFEAGSGFSGRIVPTLREFEKWLTTSQSSSKMGKTRQGVLWLIENGHHRAVRTQLGWLVDPRAVEDYERRTTRDK
jgi:hypothetical protein